ncbi:MAG: homospermidine synthase [Burkholderiales bacterium]|jgi:homospermidine synthase|nr:homospermidine synthase [Burkholderiales bacterium]
MADKKYFKFQGKIVFIGFGSVAQGVLPLLLRHIDMPRDCISIITGHDRGRAEAESFGIRYEINPLTRANFRAILDSRLERGDFLVNLSVDVASSALIEYCCEKGVLYTDSCIEPWAGGYTDPAVSASRRSNYGQREEVLELRRKFPKGPTVIPTHGANPGLISHWVKQGLVNLAQDILGRSDIPNSRDEWARLAMELGIKSIHCSERDTQVAPIRKRPGEFVNTWSVDGFIGEGSQPCELGWGSHEKHFPPEGRHHEYGCKAAIYLDRPGASVKVRTWTPAAGAFHGFLITHGEAISIADYLTVKKGDEVIYRPTCHYSYHPCDDTVLSVHELAGRNWVGQEQRRLLRDEITEGIDELGALLLGHKKGAYWYGSQLSIEEARRLAPYNNATSLQVAAGVLGGIVWAMENPDAGIIDPDDMDFRRVLEVANPYLGKLVGAYSDWTPLQGRNHPFPEDLDSSDPWQFKNVRVV